MPAPAPASCFQVHIFIIAAMHDHPLLPDWLITSPKLLRLFSVNIAHRDVHPKVIPIPLGLIYNASFFIRTGCQRADDVTPSRLMLARFDLGGYNIKARMGGRWVRRRPLMSILRCVGVWCALLGHVPLPSRNPRIGRWANVKTVPRPPTPASSVWGSSATDTPPGPERKALQ